MYLRSTKAAELSDTCVVSLSCGGDETVGRALRRIRGAEDRGGARGAPRAVRHAPCARGRGHAWGCDALVEPRVRRRLLRQCAWRAAPVVLIGLRAFGGG